jgi:hypothetical protein
VYPAAALSTGIGVRGLTRLKRPIAREPLDRRLRLCQIPPALKGVEGSGRIIGRTPSDELDDLLQFVGCKLGHDVVEGTRLGDQDQGRRNFR